MTFENMEGRSARLRRSDSFMPSNEREFPEAGQELAEKVFEGMLPELAAVPKEKLLHIRINVVTVVSIVLGCVERIRTLRARFEQALPEFDLRYLDYLEKYAWALRHTHTLYLASARPPNISPEAVKQASVLRQRLTADANSLADRGLVDRSQLRNINGRKGYRNLAVDLAILSSVLKENWQKIAQRCSVEAKELEQAILLSQLLTRAAGRRDKRPISVAKAMLARRRAFTLLRNAYDETRRGVVYLRWHEEDWDQIAPSLFAGRKRRKRKKDAPVSEATAEQAPPPPAITSDTDPRPTL